jgi:aryl-alcohol dehydrogenase-like predicted oxidoreductase
MEKRALGKSGLFIQPMVLGGNVFDWTIDEKRSFEILDAYVDSGLDCIDTADVYSYWKHNGVGGQSETVIGNWLRKSGKRDKVIIATKVGKQMGPGKKGLSKAYITQAVEDSLKRLQTDYIDLYQSHDDDKETPLAETLETYTNLIKQGKVRAIGASNYSGDRLKQAIEISNTSGLAVYQTLQPEYNLYARKDFETDLADVCKTYDLGVIPYYALASGFLTGKYRSDADLNKSARGQGVKKYLDKRGFDILNALDEVSATYKTTPASVALAWLLTRPNITAPIASATSIEQLQSIINATQLNFDKQTLDLLNKASEY